MTQLRDYQLQARQAVKDAYASGLHRAGIALPCRSGKTLIMASLSADLLAKGRRSVVLVHRDVLVDQTIRTFEKLISRRDIGVVKATKNEVHKSVIIASVQTLSRPDRLAQIPIPALTLVDEAHVSMAPSYLRVFKHFDAVPGGAGFLLGVSATWSRSDSKGLGGIWEQVVFKRSFKWAVSRGFIVPPRALQLGAVLDTSALTPSAEGDYRDSALERMVMLEDLRDIVVRGYQDHGQNRPAALFAPTKKSAQFFGEAFCEAGIKTAEVFDSTSRIEREFAFTGHRNGAIPILLTCSALSIGWDAPHCGVALLVRPFGHLTPFIQTVSRVLTPWPGKKEGLILDFVGATDNKAMRSVVDLSVSSGMESDEDDAFTEEDDELPDRTQSVGTSARRLTGITEVDLFAGTDARWLTTDYGVPFIPTKDHLYFLAQVEGAWNVGICSSRSRLNGRWLITGLESTDALHYASEAALEEDPSIAGTKSSWQRGRPTEKMAALAAQMGIDIDGMNKMRVSDELSIKIATRILSGVGGLDA